MAGTARSQTYLNAQINTPNIRDTFGDYKFLEDLIATIFDPTTEVSYGDDIALSFGTGEDAELRWSTGDASNHSFVMALGDSNQALHITDLGAIATDWNVAADTHPTVYIHSNTTPSTDYLLIGAHDGTTAFIDMVGGTTLKIGFDLLEALILAETASAVNELTITNAATATNPSIAATGGDTNIGLELKAKASGYVIAKVGRFAQKMTAVALTNTVTVTVTHLRGGIIDGTPTASSTYTLPTAQLLRQEIIGAEIGTQIKFIVNNKAGSAKTNTVAGGSADDGTLTVAQNVIRQFLITFTAVASGSETYRLDGIAA